MSIPRIPLSPPQVQSLQLTRDLGSSAIESIFSCLSVASPPPLTPSDLEQLILPSFAEKFERPSLEAVIQTALSLAATKREVGISSSEIMEAVRNGLLSLPKPHKWSEEELNNWDDVAAKFELLLDCEAILTVTKFLELSYDYCQLWKNGKILTDIRPVFNSDGTKINGTLVSYTLRVNYDDAEGCHNLSFALDEADILKLKEECDRALTKAKTASAAMVIAGFPSAITGTD